MTDEQLRKRFWADQYSNAARAYGADEMAIAVADEALAKFDTLFAERFKDDKAKTGGDE